MATANVIRLFVCIAQRLTSIAVNKVVHLNNACHAHRHHTTPKQIGGRQSGKAQGRQGLRQCSRLGSARCFSAGWSSTNVGSSVVPPAEGRPPPRRETHGHHRLPGLAITWPSGLAVSLFTGPPTWTASSRCIGNVACPIALDAWPTGEFPHQTARWWR